MDGVVRVERVNDHTIKVTFDAPINLMPGDTLELDWSVGPTLVCDWHEVSEANIQRALKIAEWMAS